MSGNVKNDIADFNLVSIYINGGKSKDNKVPESGYVLDLKNTKCTLNGEELSNITFEYKYGKVGVYGINASKTKCNIYFIDSPTNKIIATAKAGSNQISASSCKNGTNNATHSAENCGVEENGLYYLNTSLGTTYYYRGTVNNNWVKFGTTKDNLPIWWRIIRINEDGTIRLIYSGTGEDKPSSSDEEGYWTINDNSIIGASPFNSEYNFNAYVGYMYGTPNSDNYNDEHANIHDSDIKVAIDTWYQENMLEETQYLSGSTGFCGDRTTTKDGRFEGYTNLGYGANTTSYSIGERISLTLEIYLDNQIPTYECPNSKHDLYTTKNNKGEGNGALTYPVGLITADEVVFSGWKHGLFNYGYWLYSNRVFWTITPTGFANNMAHVMGVSRHDHVNNGYYSYLGLGVRPVINLKPEYLITEGKDGTITNPYTTITN